MKILRLLLSLLFVTSIEMPSAMAVDYIGPARTFMTDLVALSHLSKSSDGGVSKDSTTKVKELSARIDFNILAKTSLGPARWKSYSAPDRMKFMTTLQELLEVVVYPKAKNISANAQELKFDLNSKRPTAVKVSGQVERERKGEMLSEKMEVELIFDMKAEHIVDAVIAGELVSKNLKRQFDEALKKKTFKEIIAQMKKKVEQAKINAG